jgi:hypothetical protein
MGKIRAGIFPGAFALRRREAPTSVCRRDRAEALDPPWGNPNLISDFLQLIVARAFGRS